MTDRTGSAILKRPSSGMLSLLIAGITCLVFARLIGCDFTWWDDNETIHHNPLLNPPSWDAIGHYWTAIGAKAPMAIYIPVTYTLWAALAAVARRPTPDAYGIWLNPHLFHGCNVALHAATAVAVFQLMRLLVKDNRAAFVSALFFALHPLQIEPVGWVSGTKDVLCGCLSIIALWQYIAIAGKNAPNHRRQYALATACLLLAMLSKPTAIVTPLIAAVIDRWWLHRSWRSIARSLWPWGLLMIPCAIWTAASQPAAFVSHLPIWARPFIAGDALAFYLGKLFWPARLSMDYGRNPDMVWNSGCFHHTCAITVVLAIAMAWIGRRKHCCAAPAAAGAFVLGLLPVLGFSPFLYQYHSTVADHYLYLPLLGPAMLVGWIISRWPKQWVFAGAGVILIALAIRSAVQEPNWQNTFTLTEHAAMVTPRSFGPWDMLGFMHTIEAQRLVRSGEDGASEFAQAISCYQKAIELNPQFIPARRNLAIVYRKSNQPALALEQMREVIKLQPTLPEELREDPVELARGLAVYGDADGAIDLLNHSLSADPNNAAGWRLRAELMDAAKSPSTLRSH